MRFGLKRPYHILTASQVFPFQPLTTIYSDEFIIIYFGVLWGDLDSHLWQDFQQDTS